jgi:hypothetical protein
MNRLTILCLTAIMTLSGTPNAFGWGAVSGPRGGAAYPRPYGRNCRSRSGLRQHRIPSRRRLGRGSRCRGWRCGRGRNGIALLLFITLLLG